MVFSIIKFLSVYSVNLGGNWFNWFYLFSQLYWLIHDLKQILQRNIATSFLINNLFDFFYFRFANSDLLPTPAAVKFAWPFLQRHLWYVQILEYYYIYKFFISMKTIPCRNFDRGLVGPRRVFPISSRDLPWKTSQGLVGNVTLLSRWALLDFQVGV